MILPVICQRLRSSSRCCIQFLQRHYSTSGTSAALRPFLLAVHPDLLWQHPSKREVNENSLKHLNQFIESLQSNASPTGPDTLQFYLRRDSSDSDHQLVNVVLDRTSLTAAVSSILASCNLPMPASEESFQHAFNARSDEVLDSKSFFYRKLLQFNEETLHKRVSQSRYTDLLKYLSRKSERAQSMVRSIDTARRMTMEHSQTMMSQLKLKDIVYDNQWTWLQNRNCIEDLVRLSKEYHSHVQRLAGRTVVFGDSTGFHLNGSIVFGCRDKRRLWSEVLENIPKQNELLLKIWEVEAELADQLKGAKIIHSSWKPSLQLQNHLFWAQKLTAALADSALSLNLSQELSSAALRISLDCNSSEMRILENGDMVLCPHSPILDIVTFLNTNVNAASTKMESYRREVLEESKVHEKCVKSLALAFLYRDVNVTPGNMRKCCERLVDGQKQLKKQFQNLNVCISSYYIICEDGTVCIPWDWKTTHLEK